MLLPSSCVVLSVLIGSPPSMEVKCGGYVIQATWLLVKYLYSRDRPGLCGNG